MAAENTMTKMEAEIVLGLANVSSYDYKAFNNAFRHAVKSNHPDAGGSHASMVRVNQAKKTIDALFASNRSAVITAGGFSEESSAASTASQGWAPAGSGSQRYKTTDDPWREAYRKRAEEAEQRRREAEERARRRAEEERRNDEERRQREAAEAAEKVKRAEEAQHKAWEVENIKKSSPWARILYGISELPTGAWTVLSWAVIIGIFIASIYLFVPVLLGIKVAEMTGLSNAEAVPVMFVIWAPALLAFALRRKVAAALRKGFQGAARLVAQFA